MVSRRVSQPVSIRATSHGRDGSNPELWAALDGVIDPELGVAITDLGLVYDIAVDGDQVHVVMTTTTPVCPMGEFLQVQVVEALSDHTVTVELVHRPLWRPEMMNDRARSQLGWDQ